MSSNNNESSNVPTVTGGYKRPLRYIFDTADHQEFMKSKVRTGV